MNVFDEKLVKNQNLVKVGRKHFAINHKGYLINFNDWDEDFTKTVAEKDHLKLTECHWITIDFLRNFYREYEVPPTPRIVIKTIGRKIKSSGCTNKDIKRVFPLGGCKQACRLAGLPLHHCHVC